jgi:hypothetical protein
MSDNHGMQQVSKKVGFKLHHAPESHDFRAEYIL